MRARRVLSLLVALALFSPLGAMASSVCPPGQHCPMVGMGEESAPPCHGAAIQADDCCVSAESPEAVETAPLTPASIPGAGEAAQPAHAAAAGHDPCPIAVDTATPPLYRLFRALLI